MTHPLEKSRFFGTFVDSPWYVRPPRKIFFDSPEKKLWPLLSFFSAHTYELLACLLVKYYIFSFSMLYSCLTNKNSLVLRCTGLFIEHCHYWQQTQIRARSPDVKADLFIDDVIAKLFPAAKISQSVPLAANAPCVSSSLRVLHKGLVIYYVINGGGGGG